MAQPFARTVFAVLCGAVAGVGVLVVGGVDRHRTTRRPHSCGLVMYVLTFQGKPIAAAERFERLSEQMTLYTPAQQLEMAIVNVEVLK